MRGTLTTLVGELPKGSDYDIKVPILDVLAMFWGCILTHASLVCCEPCSQC